mmetsp:Transcript_23304/g.58279  ORF Transcript_23304/g.58279 Transcript_23304/m.58279 type:complete len:200 (-) Transcript_23304:586-1185(-)
MSPTPLSRVRERGSATIACESERMRLRLAPLSTPTAPGHVPNSGTSLFSSRLGLSFSPRIPDIHPTTLFLRPPGVALSSRAMEEFKSTKDRSAEVAPWRQLTPTWLLDMGDVVSLCEEVANDNRISPIATVAACVIRLSISSDASRSATSSPMSSPSASRLKRRRSFPSSRRYCASASSNALRSCVMARFCLTARASSI